MKKTFWIQVIKYGIVGIFNTLLTAITIWIMMYPVFKAGNTENVSPVVISVSNITGFIAGLINSFFWNRKWTFQSKNRWGKEFLKFFTAFLVCYIPQLFLVNFLNSIITAIDYRFTLGCLTLNVKTAYVCQLIGIVFYTSINFLLNKYFTFKQTNE